MQKLKSSEVAAYRKTALEAQDGRCALCGETIADGEAVLDHDHKEGHVRGVLHSGCNAMLGHIENNRPRYRMQGARLRRWLAAVFDYIHSNYDHRPLHPTHRTADEKRVRTNKLAAKRRAAKKATA